MLAYTLVLKDEDAGMLLYEGILSYDDLFNSDIAKEFNNISCITISCFYYDKGNDKGSKGITENDLLAYIYDNLSELYDNDLIYFIPFENGGISYKVDFDDIIDTTQK